MRFRSHLIVHLSRFADNYEKLKDKTSKNVLFMIKADAYGHGLLSIVRFAVESLNITEFGCASIGEAMYLRNELSDLKFDIYVFSDLGFDLDHCRDSYISMRIIPVISSYDDLNMYLENKELAQVPLCLKFDTGMNRLGIHYSEVEKVVEKLRSKKRYNLYHVCSHFSSSYFHITKTSKATLQYQRFKEICSSIKNNGITIERSSMANSGAIEQDFALDETHIRPGLMLYGPSSLINVPANKTNWKGETISDLETHIIRQRFIKKGEEVGYGDTKCPRDGIMVVVPLGYGDGLSTKYAKMIIKHEGYSGTIIGRINMDMSSILFPVEAANTLKRGNKIKIWGQGVQEISEICEQIKTIPYELFCNLSSRIPRLYSIK